MDTRRSIDIAWKALNTPELLTDGERKTAIDLFAETHDLLVSEDKKIEKAREQLQKEGKEASEKLQALCDLVYGEGRAKVEITVSVDSNKPIFSKETVAAIKEYLDFCDNHTFGRAAPVRLL